MGNLNTETSGISPNPHDKVLPKTRRRQCTDVGRCVVFRQDEDSQELL